MADIPLIGTSNPIDGPIIRLLMCFVCNTIEELPPHEGPPETDILLEMTVEKHEFPSGERHVGKLFLLPFKTWANTEQRKAIIDQLKGQGAQGLDALDPDKNFYETKMTFAQDAMDCWRSRLQPDHCGDYQNESKRLLPKTDKERMELGLPDPAHSGAPKVYLCNFCPVHSVVTTKKRAIRGMYN